MTIFAQLYEGLDLLLEGTVLEVVLGFGEVFPRVSWAIKVEVNRETRAKHTMGMHLLFKRDLLRDAK